MSAAVAIIDYGSGNLHSAAKAFERAAREAGHDVAVNITSDPDDVRQADRIVLPGVGAFADCKRGLAGVPGMIDAMTETVFGKGRPFLGICVGMQLMATRGLEYETSEGLDWIKGDVSAIVLDDPALKIPHMGWNTLHAGRGHPLLAGISTGPDGWHAYFVHSYAMKLNDNADLVASTDHGGPVTAIVAKDNLAGTQFHPEKSQKLGLRLITNFLEWKP